MHGKCAPKITSYSLVRLINSGAIAHAFPPRHKAPTFGVLGDFAAQFTHPDLIDTSLT